MSRPQLMELGYSRQTIGRRVAAARLLTLHRAVYAVGHTRLTIRGRWMAAVLACGPGAVLSHGHAAALHGLRTTPTTPIDVTAAGRRTVVGLRTHVARTLHAQDTTTIDHIPVTTLERALLDEAETLAPQRLRSRLEETLRRDVFDRRAFEATIARNPGRRGIGALGAALTALADVAPELRSHLEQRALELFRALGLSEPATNVVVHGHTVDFLWARERLIVEVDGYAFHRGRAAFVNDRRRDLELQAVGYRVIRLTADDLDDPAAVSGLLTAMLAAA